MDRQKRIITVAVAVLVLSAILLFLLPGLTPRNYRFFLGRRLPVLMAVLLGASSTALATICFQTAANNNIITPHIMGVEALYVLIQVLIIFFLGGDSPIQINPVFNFAVTLPLMALYGLLLINLLGNNQSAVFMLLMIGVVAGTFLYSLGNFIQKAIDPNEFSMLQNRLFGSVNNAQISTTIPGLILAALAAWVILRRRARLDILLLGRETSISLGIAYQSELRVLLLAATSLIAVSTAVLGPLPFLGLIGVTLGRQLTSGFKHSSLMVMSVLATIGLLLWGHLILYRLLSNRIPLAPAIMVGGGVLFIVLVFRSRNNAIG